MPPALLEQAGKLVHYIEQGNLNPQQFAHILDEAERVRVIDDMHSGWASEPSPADVADGGAGSTLPEAFELKTIPTSKYVAISSQDLDEKSSGPKDANAAARGSPFVPPSPNAVSAKQAGRSPAAMANAAGASAPVPSYMTPVAPRGRKEVFPATAAAATSTPPKKTDAKKTPPIAADNTPPKPVPSYMQPVPAKRAGAQPTVGAKASSLPPIGRRNIAFQEDGEGDDM